MSVDLGALYAAARQRITAVLDDAPDEIAERPCTATPGWTVRDVVAHLRGITEDARTGNLAGVATDPWTAAQVERHREDPLARLLHDWAVDAAPFEEFLSGPHEGDVFGPRDAPVSLRASRFELFRAMLGRRSPAQVSAFDWAGGDPTPYLEHFFVFNPRPDPLIEPATTE